MDEEVLDNLEAVEDDNETSNFPLFQQKQIAEFIKKILGDNITAQKAFRDKFNRCLSLFVFYLSHMVTVIKEDTRKKKNEKKRMQITKDDIIMTLKAIDFQEIAESIQNLHILQSSLENGIQQENQLDQGEEHEEMREIQNFENIEDEQKEEEIDDNNEQIQDNQDQGNEEIEDENNQDIENENGQDVENENDQQ
ncbi:unnamed protein product (macronuclear) [Paramecium tetraurelia]|uniref:Transcription factor CBF/NF-Y/archaeal histone domain-containing protein n=1 Tax=Paramecium tetraurelia TaxID=5888 RepID=A0DGD4_PARTE|nr:uncharacterized protein GSPATT00002230001 [Paramecium tetraurelia]CAK82101.1 unnamed protein product [Paramecium tetraurelia]|eukprot:XP_001449498.1 hypothetical protein (macronuclear) [Paramecium tetraurelia strain d4-2]